MEGRVRVSGRPHGGGGVLNGNSQARVAGGHSNEAFDHFEPRPSLKRPQHRAASDASFSGVETLTEGFDSIWLLENNK